MGKAAVQSATGSAMSQGAQVLLGMEHKMNWNIVGEAALAGGVGAAVGMAANKGIGKMGWTGEGFGRQTTLGTTSGFAGGYAVARSRGGKVDTDQVFTDAFGNALAEGLKNEIVKSSETATPASSKNKLSGPLEALPGFGPADSSPLTALDKLMPKDLSQVPLPELEKTPHMIRSGETLSLLGHGDLERIGRLMSTNGMKTSDIQAGREIDLNIDVNITREQAIALAKGAYQRDNARIAQMNAKREQASSAGAVSGDAYIMPALEYYLREGARNPVSRLLMPGGARAGSSDHPTLRPLSPRAASDGHYYHEMEQKHGSQVASNLLSSRQQERSHYENSLFLTETSPEGIKNHLPGTQYERRGDGTYTGVSKFVGQAMEVDIDGSLLFAGIGKTLFTSLSSDGALALYKQGFEGLANIKPVYDPCRAGSLLGGVEWKAGAHSAGSLTELEVSGFKFVPSEARAVAREVEAFSGLKISKPQRSLLAQELREFDHTFAVSKQEYSAIQREYAKQRVYLMKEWEIQTGQSWPLGPDGMRCEAHHIIPQRYGGPNTWWNLQPIARPSHQGGIHRPGTMTTEIFPFKPLRSR